MPIVSRVLDHVRPQHGTTVRVRETLTDAKGRVIVHSYLAQSEAQANTDMAARDVTPQLEESDFHDLLVWVKTKNGSDTFDWTDRDITELRGEELLLTWFAETRGDPAIAIAWWVNDFNPPQYNAIRDRVGFDPATGSEIQDRAIDLEAAEVRFNQTVKAP